MKRAKPVTREIGNLRIVERNPELLTPALKALYDTTLAENHSSFDAIIRGLK